ncbi:MULTISPECIES: hypothetical protein [unclassified Acinetobacter]|uniref:hypothetical protein n=1 Tax=unclassified Acinetobacter TaxID=196816 RepID=UPI0015D2766C|nr:MULTISPECIES: hypothetical protein [unclassified Acinetobacter]MDM1762617.1 hypothetical protein [Acinetobacter sp. 251-1]
MDIFSRLINIKSKYNITLYEGENFKQALYNGKMTDSADCIIEKIELTLKHYPNSTGIGLSTYQSDETSSGEFCYAVALPVD